MSPAAAVGAICPAPVSRNRRSQTLWALLSGAVVPLQTLLAAPVALFLLALAVMLFRPPNLEFHSIDRVAFCLLASVALLRALILRQRLRPPGKLALPMAGLTLLATASALCQPFQAATWSTLAAKFVVPFTMFWLTGLVFRSERDLRWLERFLLVVLAYLSFTAVAFLFGAHELVVPRFILDESLGIHADRARGPFLQAVANGVTLNLLGLFAIERYRKGRLRGLWAVLLLGSLPVAIVATKTRAVWAAFSGSILWLVLRFRDRRLRRAAAGLATAAMIALFAASWMGNAGPDLGDRLKENSPVEFRLAAYRAGWDMFLERPLTGWGTGRLQTELPGRIEGFRGESFAVHNTYLEILVEHGVAGFLLYGWLLLRLFGLGRHGSDDNVGVSASIRSLWPLLLGVYLFNAMFVVMNYQFVSGLLFTFAGIVASASQARRADCR